MAVAPSQTSDKLIQRANFVALKNATSGHWDYYPVKVDVEAAEDGKTKLVDIERYKGPLGEGYVILRRGLVFSITARDLSRLRMLRSQETNLRKLIGHDSADTTAFGITPGAEYDAGEAAKIITDQVQAVHGMSDTEAPWRI